MACFPAIVKNDVFVAKNCKYVLPESSEGFCCGPRKPANPCHPGSETFISERVRRADKREGGPSLYSLCAAARSSTLCAKTVFAQLLCFVEQSRLSLSTSSQSQFAQIPWDPRSPKPAQRFIVGSTLLTKVQSTIKKFSS